MGSVSQRLRSGQLHALFPAGREKLIRPFRSLGELQQVEKLQRRAWRCPDLEIVPSHLLQAHMHHGACLLGAWEEERLTGFVYGLICPEGYLYSHLAAVAPELQGQGIGYRLKLAQADWARQRGVPRIVWTYDPLQAVNARLNILKLGAVASRYWVDYYGELQDELNQGLPSDRLEVDWWLDGRSPGLPERWLEFPWPLPDRLRRHWRLESRRFFQEAFAQGLVVNAFDLQGGVARYGAGRA